MIDYDIYVHTLFFKEKVAEFDKSFCQGIEDAWCWRGRSRPRPISFFFFFFFVAFVKVECLYFAEVHGAGRRLADVERASDCLVRFCRHQT